MSTRGFRSNLVVNVREGLHELIKTTSDLLSWGPIKVRSIPRGHLPALNHSAVSNQQDTFRREDVFSEIQWNSDIQFCYIE